MVEILSQHLKRGFFKTIKIRGVLDKFAYRGVRTMFFGLKFHLKAIFLGLKFANMNFPFFGGKNFQHAIAILLLGLNLTLHTPPPLYKYGKYPPPPIKISNRTDKITCPSIIFKYNIQRL